MKTNNFWVFIMSYHSPNKCKTYDTLQKYNYKGKVAIIIDDKDDVEAYKKNFPYVFVFSKEDECKVIDKMNNFDNLCSPLFARHACFQIAKDHGIDVFLTLDDDISSFEGKFDLGNSKVKSLRAKFDLDYIFSLFVDLLTSTPLKSVSFSQGGDTQGNIADTRWKRETMNSWFSKTDNPFLFYGFQNDDVNTFLQNGRTGGLFFSYKLFLLHQAQTQSKGTGLGETYRATGTYQKSFYSVMLAPSCVSVVPFASSSPRLHHRIITNLAYPKVISDKFESNKQNLCQSSQLTNGETL